MISVPAMPEGVAIAPNGRWIAASSMAGYNLLATDPGLRRRFKVRRGETLARRTGLQRSFGQGTELKPALFVKDPDFVERQFFDPRIHRRGKRRYSVNHGADESGGLRHFRGNANEIDTMHVPVLAHRELDQHDRMDERRKLAVQNTGSIGSVDMARRCDAVLGCGRGYRRDDTWRVRRRFQGARIGRVGSCDADRQGHCAANGQEQRTLHEIALK